MTFTELDKKLDKTIKEVQNNFNGAMMAIIGSEARTMINKRITETGTDADGKKYKSPSGAVYSTKPTMVGCKTFTTIEACNTLLGDKEKRKKLEWRTINGHRLAILPGGYKKIRELDGLKTDKVNFLRTGRMWEDINVISKKSDHQRGIAIIGARTDENKDKLAGNTKRFGDILDLSKSEQEGLIRRYNLQVLQIFKENGL